MAIKKGLLKNPLFYFGLGCFLLFSSMYVSSGIPMVAKLATDRNAFFNDFFNDNRATAEDLFSSQSKVIALETPDLKTIQDNTISAISTPTVVSNKVLGDTFGSTQNQKEIVEYTVQAGDTLQSIANAYNISTDTLLWANDLTSSAKIKVGQDLVVLPINGVLHIVKAGDTIGQIATTYKAKESDIVSFNSLSGKSDIYIGDILVVPDGIMPKKNPPTVNSNNQIPVASNYFIYPIAGKITQGLHYYNAIDIANNCGNPVYAAASGVVQQTKFGWNLGGGNYITILHPNGVVTYYGHLLSIFVKPGDTVKTGDRIGLIGQTGKATGCHVHFDVRGGRNPLASYPVGTWLKY